MKITRFAQSCILLETKRKKILVDPGNIRYKESYHNNEWKDIDVLLITHKHKDHCYIDAIKRILNNSKTKLYATQDVASFYPKLSVNIVKIGDILELDYVKIEVVKAVHGHIPIINIGKDIKENVGYIIDDGNFRVYQTGDTVKFENNYKCDVIFVPVCNHKLVMDSLDAAIFAKKTEANLVIPFHYDVPIFNVNLKKVEKNFIEHGLNYKILNIEESISL